MLIRVGGNESGNGSNSSESNNEGEGSIFGEDQSYCDSECSECYELQKARNTQRVL